MKDIVERKNAKLRLAYEKLSQVNKYALSMQDIMFNSADAADTYLEIMSKTLKEITWGRFDFLEESQIDLSEPVEADSFEDLPFVNPDEEVKA